MPLPSGSFQSSSGSKQSINKQTKKISDSDRYQEEEYEIMNDVKAMKKAH